MFSDNTAIDIELLLIATQICRLKFTKVELDMETPQRFTRPSWVNPHNTCILYINGYIEAPMSSCELWFWHSGHNLYCTLMHHITHTDAQSLVGKGMAVKWVSPCNVNVKDKKSHKSLYFIHLCGEPTGSQLACWYKDSNAHVPKNMEAPVSLKNCFHPVNKLIGMDEVPSWNIVSFIPLWVIFASSLLCLYYYIS